MKPIVPMIVCSKEPVAKNLYVHLLQGDAGLPVIIFSRQYSAAGFGLINRPANLQPLLHIERGLEKKQKSRPHKPSTAVIKLHPKPKKVLVQQTTGKK